MTKDDLKKTKEELINELVELRKLSGIEKSGPTYKDVLEQSPFGIVLYKPNGKPYYVNPTYKKFMGLSNETLRSILKDYNIFKELFII